jgi:hypothetical protein
MLVVVVVALIWLAVQELAVLVVVVVGVLGVETEPVQPLALSTQVQVVVEMDLIPVEIFKVLLALAALA